MGRTPAPEARKGRRAGKGERSFIRDNYLFKLICASLFMARPYTGPLFQTIRGERRAGWVRPFAPP